MALPQNLGITSGGNQNASGIFQVGGAYYAVGRHSFTFTDMSVVKASDPTGTWTEQDSSNRPVAAADLTGTRGVLLGTTIYLYGQTASGNFYFGTYSTSSDTYTLEASPINVGGLSTGDGYRLFAQARSDGDQIVAYKNTVTIMGAAYDRARYARREGTTWTTDIEVSSISNKVEQHEHPAGIVMTSADRAHIFYVNATNLDLLLSTLLSSNSWGVQSTSVDTSLNGVLVFGQWNGIAFSDGGTVKVRFPYIDSDATIGTVRFNDADSPSVSTGQVNTTTFPYYVTVVADGTTQHLIGWGFDLSAGVRYASTGAGDDTWSSYTTHGSAATANIVDGHVYTRSGQKLGFTYVTTGNQIAGDEIDLGGGAVIGTANQASETDTAQALTAARRIAIGQASETDTAQATSPGKATSISEASETDTAQAIAHAKAVSLVQASETDTAQTGTPARVISVGQAAESDLARNVGWLKQTRVEAGQASETDTAQAVAHAKALALGQASETDSAQSLTAAHRVAIGQSVETDEAQPIAHAKSVALGQSSEADTAQILSPAHSLTIAQASETDTAQPLTHAKAVALGQASETDAAQAVTAGGATTIGQASETDTAQAVTAARRVSTAQASETDTAQAVAPAKATTAGQASETDTAQAVTHARAVTIGQASETDTAQAVSVGAGIPIGQATETDTAQTLSPARAFSVGQASESDAAQTLSPARSVAIGQASEVNAAQTLTAARAVLIGLASETDTGSLTTPARVIPVGQAAEADLARNVGWLKQTRIEVGQAFETDAAGTIAHARAIIVGVAAETDSAFELLTEPSFPSTTEASRRLTVHLESRLLSVTADARTLDIGAETRVLQVSA